MNKYWIYNQVITSIRNMTGSKGGYVTVDSDEREDDVEDEEEQKRIIDPNRKNCRPLYMFLSVVIPLVLLNILLSGLWWRCYHISEENCVRPKLSYCTFLPA